MQFVMVTISAAAEASPEVVEAVTRLLPQMSTTAPPPSKEDVATIIEAPATTLFLARDDAGAIIGILTLVLFRIPSALRARIEDVIVDESARGQRVGEMLTRTALDAASAAGARGVDLTSRPSREAANRLYQRMGFARRESNVYRYELA
jgi:ribosomal protein S18 acetylase RimI-like enzyme